MPYTRLKEVATILFSLQLVLHKIRQKRAVARQKSRAEDARAQSIRNGAAFSGVFC